MEDLPLQVLETISECLEFMETRRRSLLAFALTSKVCCAGAAREWFLRISLKVYSSGQLRNELKILEEFLVVPNRTRFVRKIRIAGSILLSAWNEEGKEVDTGTVATSGGEIFQQTDIADYGDAFADLSTSYISNNIPHVRDGREEESRRESPWKPLLSSLSDCPLVDLVWASTD
jgi:hypothetical protein